MEQNVQNFISTASDLNTDDGAKIESIPLPLDKRICLIGNSKNDPASCRAAQHFAVPVVTSDSGLEFVKDLTCATVFILDDFEHVNMKELQKPPHRILGSIALQQFAERKERLPVNTRPLFNQAMAGVVVCFTGFRKKEDLTRLIPLIHHMGASIRKDMVAKVTHLIANCCGGDKYQYATTFKVPVLSHTWVTASWEHRSDITFSATSESFIETHKLKPFYGARVCFLGFSDDETKHMHEILEANGGQITDTDDTSCTHMVLENRETFSMLSPNANHDSPSTSFLQEHPTHNSTPQKRKLNESSDEIATKRSRRESLDLETPIRKLQLNIFKTPVHLFQRRKSISSTVTSNEEQQSDHSFNLFMTPKSIFKRCNKTRRKTDTNLIQIPESNTSIDDVDITMSEITPSLTRYEERIPFTVTTDPISTSHDQDGPSSRFSTNCTRVVDESSVTERPDGPPKALLVKAEWFWASVQNVACADEKDYLFDDYLDNIVSPCRRDSHAATPSSSSSRRKRKRLHETISQLVRNDSPAVHKRRSSVSDAGLLSVSGSFLDCTTSPDKLVLEETEETATDALRKNLSPRQQVFLELIQTESNYVNILRTIMTMFKSHLEDMPESEALLNNTELKIIFGNLPPIYETHKKMLEELRWASAHWSEDTSIGNILLKYATDLLKAYPPFVNFFEEMKDMLTQCDQNKPRFHAFLKICQTKAECGRQSLQDLLIRPVQRLPSISLLLKDILKHTNKNNPDNMALEKALNAIKEVMTHINEDKRKTEGQRVMFDIFNEIDNCPPELISSHRSFITKCEVTQLSEGLSGRGNSLVLFLFTDQLEVCKKRSKTFNTLKSPNTTNGFHLSNKTAAKPYKHVAMMALNGVKRVIDIRETDECQKVFALVTRDHQELKEKLFSFAITETLDKQTFLKTLCRHIANTAYSADSDKFLAYLEPHQLDIDTSDVTMGTLSKAYNKFASRTRLKVGRAFSFNKTPSKLKRAMSTMMSPFGSSTNITPASQLANMRLASYNNINELGTAIDTNETSSNETLVAPMSVQPTRKLKCSSLSVTALKRL